MASGELHVGVFLPPVSVLSGAVERTLKVVEYSRGSNIHCTLYLDAGTIRNDEIRSRFQELEGRGLLTIRRAGGGSRGAPLEPHDGLLIPSEFWTAAWNQVRLSNARGTLCIEYHQLPYVGTFDVLKATGGTTMWMRDILRFPLAASKIFGDSVMLASAELALCAVSIQRANRLQDCRFLAMTPVVRRNMEAAGFSGTSFVPRVPLGVEPEPIRAATRPAPERVYDGVYVGRFHPHKGFLDLPLIAAHLKDRVGEGLRIAVCGSPSFPRHWERFQRLVADLGVAKNLVVRGRVSKSELYRTIRQSRMLLYPSYVDGFSITVLESLSLQTPVLAYAIDALRAIWGQRKGVFLVPVGNPAAFAARFVDLRDHGLLNVAERDLRAQSDRLMTEYSWSAVAADERRFIEGASPGAVRESELAVGG